jgi:hypothetical protein
MISKSPRRATYRPALVSNLCDPVPYRQLQKLAKGRGIKPPTKIKLCEGLLAENTFADPNIMVIGDIEGSGLYFAQTMALYKDEIEAKFLVNSDNEIYSASTYAKLCTDSDNIAPVLKSIQLNFLNIMSNFVVVGDTPDRGDRAAFSQQPNLSLNADDEVICKALTAFKLEYPTRVRLVAGNRELTKLRIIEELADQSYFIPTDNSVQTGLRLNLNDLSDQINKLSRSGTNNTKLAELRKERFRIQRKYSMGVTHDTTSEKADYPAAIFPGGWMHDYLAQCELIVRVGTTLFVHGAVTPDNYLLVPDGYASDITETERGQLFKNRERMPDCMRMTPTTKGINAWIATLNRWYFNVVTKSFPALLKPKALLALYDFDMTPRSPTRELKILIENRRKVEALVDLALGDNLAPNTTFCNKSGPSANPDSVGKVKSVVAADNLRGILANFDLKNIDGQRYVKLVNDLLHVGVWRVISGHKPLGKTPVPLVYSVNGKTQFVFCSIDTTYSSCGASPGRAPDDALAVYLTRNALAYYGTTSTQTTSADSGQKVIYSGELRSGKKLDIGKREEITGLLKTAVILGKEDSNIPKLIYYNPLVKLYECNSVFR